MHTKVHCKKKISQLSKVENIIYTKEMEGDCNRHLILLKTWLAFSNIYTCIVLIPCDDGKSPANVPVPISSYFCDPPPPPDSISSRLA